MRWLRIFSVVFLCGALAVFGPGCGDSGDTASPRTPAHLAKTSPDNDSTPTFSWHAADGGPGIDHYTVSIDEGEPADVGNVTEYTAGDGISEGSHTIVVTPYDGEGNAGEGASRTFVCDATPPAVSAVAVSGITETRATITWTTSENATSQVEYGPTTGYGSSSSLDTGLLTTHSVSLSGLASGTTIHYRVKSKDWSGNESRSDDGSFSTCGAAGPAVSGIAASEIGEASAKITWTTDKPATSQVRYGPGAKLQLGDGAGRETGYQPHRDPDWVVRSRAPPTTSWLCPGTAVGKRRKGNRSRSPHWCPPKAWRKAWRRH